MFTIKTDIDGEAWYVRDNYLSQHYCDTFLNRADAEFWKDKLNLKNPDLTFEVIPREQWVKKEFKPRLIKR